jgi:hypothetical protein
MLQPPFGDSSEGHQGAARTSKIGGFKMRPYCENTRLYFKLSIATLLAAFATTIAAAQDKDLLEGVTYVCNGERMFIENCNPNPSDNASCMVGHPDHVMANGLMKYTNETRGALKKLFPTCTQPSAKELAAQAAFKKKQQEIYAANVAKANPQANNQASAARPQAQGASPQQQITPPKNADERAMRRCISSGRLPATCTGNSLLGAFSQMIGQVLPGADKTPAPGPVMAGVFQGAGSWRFDFIDGGVLVNCSFLSPNQEAYSLDFKGGRTVLTINTTPRPLVLTYHADNTITGPPGPVTIDGVVPGGYSAGSSTPGHTETSQTTTHETVNQNQTGMYGQSQLTYQGNGQYDVATTHTNSTYVPGTSTPGYTNFTHKRATCPAINLSTKGASVGIQTMQTDLLKSMFSDGQKGPPTPPGVRMHGIFAASTGFSVQFFPESAILGCGPDAARAYPYTVVADGTKAVVKIDAPDHPLNLTFASDGSLDPGGSGLYQVHGRIVTGQNENDDFTFAPMEQTCNLSVLTPSKAIPSTGGTAATMIASAGAPGPRVPATANPVTLSTPSAPLGNATLSIVSGFPAQPGAPNPLAGRPYVLLRDSYASALAKGGISVPPGMSPYKYVANTCVSRTPDCQKILDAVNANAASAVRADANGSGIFPGVAPGTYYLMISTRFNNQPLIWSQPVQLKPGPNSMALDLHNATPVN